MFQDNKVAESAAGYQGSSITRRTAVRMAVGTSVIASAPALFAKDNQRQGSEEEIVTAPKMEVCFVLDTTGSMGGLIAGAKEKIWSIANTMISAKPTPKIKFGLIGYRDRNDVYVTKVSDLTDDVDLMYGNLMQFTAQGGGDGPESVNQALNESVQKMTWSKDRRVLKMIFLVGDAPPHMDYDEIQYPDICQTAVSSDLIINTIQCGSLPATRKIWEEIAKKSEGKFVAIQQNGGVVSIKSPHDIAIFGCTSRLGKTVCGYGTAKQRQIATTKNQAALSSSAEANADRATYNFASKGAAGSAWKVITGDEDLIALLEEKKVDIDNIDAEKLPPELRKLSKAELRDHLSKLLSERKKVQQELDKLLKKRREFVQQETERLKREGKDDGFDSKVKDIIRAQARTKGIELKE